MTATTEPDVQAADEARSSSTDRRHNVAVDIAREEATSTASEHTLAVNPNPPPGVAKEAALHANDSDHTPPPQRTKDFGFIPIPRWRRYDPAMPFQFSMFLNYIFAFVGNLPPSREWPLIGLYAGCDIHGRESVLLSTAACSVLAVIQCIVRVALAR